MIDNLRAALHTVRNAQPAEIKALDDAEKAAADAAAREAKRKADLAAKVEAGMEARTQALIDDYVAIQQDALRAAAEELARRHLEAELGVTSAKQLTFQGYPQARLTPERIEYFLKKLSDAAIVTWDKSKRSADQLRSQGIAAAHAAVEAERADDPVDDVEARVAQQRARLEANRQRAIAERKRAAGIIPTDAA